MEIFFYCGDWSECVARAGDTKYHLVIDNGSQYQNICVRSCATLRSVYMCLTLSSCHAILCTSPTEKRLRKIEQQMIDAIKENKSFVKDNTEVMYSPSRVVSCVYLHGNLIATIGTNYVEVYDGGWQTTTTKSRLNALIKGLCNGYTCGVYQHKFEWFVHDENKDDRNVIPFENGYTFERV